jgi:hypothetical protein
MTTRATPDELDLRASRATGWKARLLRRLADEARAYRPEPVEIELTARRVA